MESFLERFYEEVKDNLSDPHTSTRLTTARMLRDLHAADRDIFERLLNTTLQESNLGFAEATISLVTDQPYYLLPPGFRQFYRLTQYQDTARTVTLDSIGSKSHYQSRYGIEILSAERGFRLKPAPIMDGDWVMSYARAPGLLHHAKAKRISDNSLTCGVPGADGGEVVTLDDYYNGCEVRIYKADLGVLQTRVVTESKIVNGEMVLFLRNAWSPLPRGEVWYEICPTLPSPYDTIYAMDVALLNMSRRSRPERVQEVMLMRQKKWDAARALFQNNVSDRPPERILPLRGVDRMSSEIPYPYYG